MIKEYLVVEYYDGWKPGMEPYYHRVIDTVHSESHVSYKNTLWYWLAKAKDGECSISVYEIGQCALDWS